VNTITYRQDKPAARIAIVVASVALISGLLVYVFGLTSIIGVVESSREVAGGRQVVAVVVSLIFFPPAFILVRYLTPKHEVVFGESALTIKARGEQKAITYAEIGSMVLERYMSPRLGLYDRSGQLLHWFRTGMDKAALSSIVRLTTERIAFDTRSDPRAVRYVRA
jgi:hypothetical protein